MITRVQVTIPGKPVAQGRPRFVSKPFPRAIDPDRSKDWKGRAQVLMSAAVETGPPFPRGTPLRLEVVAVFQCPSSDARKRVPRGRRPHAKRPDGDNLLKAVKDAGSGVLWHDDAQITDARVVKVIGAQDEAPRVVLIVEAEDHPLDGWRKPEGLAFESPPPCRRCGKDPCSTWCDGPK